MLYPGKLGCFRHNVMDADTPYIYWFVPGNIIKESSIICEIQQNLHAPVHFLISFVLFHSNSPIASIMFLVVANSSWHEWELLGAWWITACTWLIHPGAAGAVCGRCARLRGWCNSHFPCKDPQSTICILSGMLGISTFALHHLCLWL